MSNHSEGKWLWLLILPLLSGCWDQNLLSRSIIQLGYGVDLAENGKVRTTFTLVTSNKKTIVTSSEGETPRDTKLHANQRLPGNIDSSKNRVVLISEEAAKKGIYPYLDVLYRDPKSALNAKIGIVEGTVEKMLNQYADSPAMRKFDGFFTSMEKSTSIPKTNVQNTCTILFDNGQDNLLPFLTMDDTKQIVIGGSAMFHQEYYTGKLSKDDTELLLLMKGELADTVQLKIHTGEASGIKGYATSNTVHMKRDLDVDSKNGHVSAKLSLNLDLQMLEYPLDRLEQEERLRKLEREYEEQLTNRAKRIFEKLQAGKCDALGIGRIVQAFHPKQWKRMKWDEEYPKVRFEPQINVRIVGTGIMS